MYLQWKVLHNKIYEQLSNMCATCKKKAIFSGVIYFKAYSLFSLLMHSHYLCSALYMNANAPLRIIEKLKVCVHYCALFILRILKLLYLLFPLSFPLSAVAQDDDWS